MRADYYLIDGENQKFNTLKAAKWHVYIAYTKNERIKYLNNSMIIGVNKKTDETVSVTPIKIDDNGDYSFGKTEKYYNIKI